MKNVLMFALLALSAPAFAGNSDLYGGLDVGTTKVKNVGGQKPSYGLFIGQQMGDGWATEFGYRRLAKYDYGGLGDVKVEQVHVSVLGTWALSPGLGLYGRLGLNHLMAKVPTGDNDENNRGLFGLGLSFNATQRVMLRAEVQRPTNDATNFSLSAAMSF